MNLTEKILAKLKEQYDFILGNIAVVYKDLDWLLDSNVALRAVVELHKPDGKNLYDQPACRECIDFPNGFDAFPLAYPCPTIQAIEKELG
jgi:hypothetical protein